MQRANLRTNLIITLWILVAGFIAGALIGFVTAPPTAASPAITPQVIVQTATLQPDTPPPSPTLANVTLAPTLPVITATDFALDDIQRVLIISVDGLRADAIFQPDGSPSGYAPIIHQLAEGGAASWTAQTIWPSATIPGHASMLTGYGVEKHGIDIFEYQSLNDRAPYIQVPTIFELAHQNEMRTVYIVGKKKMDYLIRPGSLDIELVLDGASDSALAEKAIQELRKDFDLMFVHLTGTDTAGTTYTWMSQEYLQAVQIIDGLIQNMVADLAANNMLESTLIIITADHGGHDVGHTSGTPEDLTIPWVLYGPGVLAGHTLSEAPIVYDTAATALWALGLPLPTDLDGKPVLEAFGLLQTPLEPAPLDTQPASPGPSVESTITPATETPQT